MGSYCCCGVKMTLGDWVCECDWNGWSLCYEKEHIPVSVPVKEIPDKDGIYSVRTFEDIGYGETTSAFSVVKKHWGQSTNIEISHWEIDYFDGYMGMRGVYAWKELQEGDEA